MSTSIDKMRDILNGRGTNGQDPRATFTKIVEQMPVDEVTHALSEVTRDIHMPVLDHLLIEVLHQRIKTDDQLVTAVQNDLLTKGGDTEFWLVLLRVFDSLLRKKRGAELKRQQFLEKLAANEARPLRLRASAIRRFNLKPGPASMKKLSPFLNTCEPWLINAAGHAVSHWQQLGEPIDADHLKPVYAFSKQNPDQVVELPAVLRILSQSSDPDVHRIVDRLSMTVTGEDRARLINVVGEKLTSEQLFALTMSVLQDWDMQSELVLQSLFIDNPKQVETLYQRGEEQPYLYGLSLLPGKMKLNGIKRLEDIRGGSPAVSREAGRMLRHIETFGPQARTRVARNLSPQENVIRYLDTGRLRVSELFRADPGKVADGFNTGFHKADALYVELGPGFGIAGQHWHVGVYLGFIPSRQGREGTLAIAQAGQIGFRTTGFLDFDCIELMRTSATFESPVTSVADEMQTLRDNLIRGLQEFDSSRTFQGARRTPGMTAETAEGIAATAASFSNRGIDYTATDMMNHKWPGWSGTVGDIHATRCDGVVEFSYEKHGVIVSRGLNAARANISSANVANLTNHNDLHLGSLQPGELCPRVQAGDQGDVDHQGALNSRMTTAEGPSLPQIDHFYVSPYFWVFPPMINFRVSAQRYNHVYIRLTVRKDSEPFKFVRTDSLGTTESIDASWRFERVPSGFDVTAFWVGKTTDGTDYQNQTGTYEFRLVAVDLAGNVSELRRATVDIHWP